MNVVDSSGWIEYLTDGARAAFFAPAIEKVASAGQTVLTALRQGKIVPLDEVLAVAASRLGLAHHLPLADAIVLATARAASATLWTQDQDFEGLPRVRYQRKAKAQR